MPRRIAIVLRDYDTQPVELLLGFIATVWGVWLLMPWQSLSLSPQASVLLRLAPQLYWGCVLLPIGVVQLYSMVTGNRIGRRIGSVASAFWWCWFAVATGLANWHSAGLPIFTIYFLAQLWIVSRVF